MTPDAIIIFSAGVMPREGGGWRTTTYDESDGFGTMGGRDRVEAAALLAEKYPNAVLVATCKRMDDVLPTLASVYADELRSLGVASERILKEEISVNTRTGVQQAIRLAREKKWNNLLLISSEFQLPRITAFWESENSGIASSIISSESLLAEHDPEFAERFEKVKQSSAYQKRLAAEARGVAAVKSGNYHPAPIEDKRERSV